MNALPEGICRYVQDFQTRCADYAQKMAFQARFYVRDTDGAEPPLRGG